ncbi:alpha/beta-hydrolase [Meredithblackwellia eburnea MCA 4105]
MSTQLDVVFKTVKGVELKATIFSPEQATTSPAPAVLYFHSGGLTGGSRLGFLPLWLVESSLGKGWAFVTVDYRLIPTANMDELFEDFRDAYDFVVGEKLESILKESGKSLVDRGKVVIAGASAGVYAASSLALRLSNANLAPKAFLGMYGETNIGADFYNKSKDESTTFGLTTQRSMEDLQYLFSEERLPVIAGDVKWFQCSREGLTEAADLEAYDQTNLTNQLFYNGVTADVFTSIPGLSAQLSSAQLHESDLSGQRKVVPAHLLPYFPLLSLPSNFPPSVLVHGTADKAIPFTDTVVFHDELLRLGVPVLKIIIDHPEAIHGFDRGDRGKWDDYLVPAFEKVCEFVENQ